MLLYISLLRTNPTGEHATAVAGIIWRRNMELPDKITLMLKQYVEERSTTFFNTHQFVTNIILRRKGTILISMNI